jgi:hypothetical protein
VGLNIQVAAYHTLRDGVPYQALSPEPFSHLATDWLTRYYGHHLEQLVAVSLYRQGHKSRNKVSPVGPTDDTSGCLRHRNSQAFETLQAGSQLGDNVRIRGLADLILQL